MTQETEDLIRKLAPFQDSPRQWREAKLNQYNLSRFNPTARKAIQAEIRGLADHYDIENQPIIHPLPKTWEVGGEYPFGTVHYGRYGTGIRFGLRSPDFIKHVGIFGATGAGKTTTAKQIIRLLCEKSDPFLILDPKGTWTHVIKYPWARDVNVLRLGSSFAPYTFDPFMALEGQDIEVLVADVIDSICAAMYLGHGAKSLIRDACEAVRDDLSLRNVYGAFLKLDTKGAKRSMWADSTKRALEAMATGVLGRVLNSPDNIPFPKLMASQVILVMDLLTDDDQIALFNALLLNRIYWYRKLAGVKEVFKHLLIFEEFHVLSSAEKAKGESRIDYMVKMCREYSQGVMVMDQNPGKISDTVLGNLNTVISMNLGHSRDINSVGTALAMEPEHKRYLGRLGVGEAICKVKDRLKDPVLVKVDHPDEVRKPDSPTDVEVVAHNGDFVKAVPQETKGFEPSEVEDVSRPLAGIKLTSLDRKILRYLKSNNDVNLKTLYLAHGLSYRRGNTIKKKLEGHGFVHSEQISTPTGKATLIHLTEKGHGFLGNTEDSRRLGGPWHRGAVEAVAKDAESKGFIALREYRGVDLLVRKGSEDVAYEFETLQGTKELVHAVQNILKASKVADRVVSVVRDEASAKKLRKAVSESPVRNYRGLKIAAIPKMQLNAIIS